MKILLAIAASLVLLGCASGPPDIKVTTTEAEAPKPEARPPLPNPQPIETAPVEFKVLTRDNLPDGEFVYYVLTVRGYEVMSRNFADILRWVKEAKWRLDYYRNEGGVDGVSPGKPQPEAP